MSPQSSDAGPSIASPYARQPQPRAGYPEHVLQPAYAGWEGTTTSPRLQDNFADAPEPSTPSYTYPNNSPKAEQNLRPVPSTPSRERLKSSTSVSSMSSAARGRRAPAPAALDLSPNTERTRYGDVGLGHTGASGEGRRVVTEPAQRAARPLPHPPSQQSLQPTNHPSLPPSAYTSPIMMPSPYGGREPGPSSYDAYSYNSPILNSRLSSSQLASPGQPDPSNIDRRALIGVGELATPRWGATHHARTPSMPFTLGSSPSVPQAVPGSNVASPASSAPKNWAEGQRDVGLGFSGVGGAARPRASSSAQTPPRLPTKSPAREQRERDTQREPATAPNSATTHDLSRDDSLFSLHSLADFNFDSSMEAALAASLAMPTPTVGGKPRATSMLPQSTQTPAYSSSTHAPHVPADIQPPSPGSARSRIYARRQERAATTGITTDGQGLPQPPSSAESQTFGFGQSHRASRDVREGRESRKTPPNQAKHSSSHDILKQFAVKDFSHLPPSPSSASINQFLRGSGSINNMASASASAGTGTGAGSSSTPPASASGSNSYFLGGKPGVQRSDSQRLRTTPKASTSAAAATSTRDVDPSTEEALRKLDGLAVTPGKGKPRGKASTSAASVALASRPGTPTAVPSSSGASAGAGAEGKKSGAEGRLAAKRSVESFRDTDSPLRTWVDIGEEVPAMPSRAVIPPSKRESSSSTSIIGTPTSRDSHSLPTASTTPSSTDIMIKPRRASAGSDASVPSVNISDAGDSDAQKYVPPVPPLPKVYAGTNDVTSPTHSPLEAVSPVSTSGQMPSAHAPAPPKMNKKWSFSSALSLKMGGSSPAPSVEDTTPRSPQTPWTEIHRGELLSPGLHDTGSGGDSVQGHAQQAITPVTAGQSQTQGSGQAQMQAPAPVKPSNAKRLTPSSIPFFRRASSSSIQSKAAAQQQQQQQQAPETPQHGYQQFAQQQQQHVQQESKVPTGSQSRKSVLGMHLPSMLRGSTSKRGLAQQLAGESAQGQAGQEKEKESQGGKSAGGSTGWTGRRRGKTLSISGDVPRPVPNLKHQSSVESSLNSRSSTASNHSESTVNGTTAHTERLPAIVGSPARPADKPRYSNSPRDLPSVTPTKIPRMTNRPGISSPSVMGVNSAAMPPPPFPSTKGKTVSAMSSMTDMGGRPPVSEFGVVDGVTSTPRQTTSGAHRAHLLAPMSARQDTKRTYGNRPSDPPPRREPPATVVPPSRRQLPHPPPSSTLTAMTLSASAKRSSREFRASRRDSRENSQDGGSSGQATPIKPSKSLHSTMSLPPSASGKIPTSISAGAPGPSLRKISRASESPSMSPAEDEESLGDAEMAAYVKRRRDRAAAGKKDDLSDVNEFPEDTRPVQPLSQRAFVTKNFAMMSDVERKEVLDFDEIYYSPPAGKVRRPPQPGGAMYNHGYDDERGDYLVMEGDHLCYRYEVGGVLGKGSFGQVVQCRDHKTGRSVAVKIIRNKKRFHAQALVEVKILQQLVEWDPEDKHFMVRMTDHFSFRSHLCIVTELLSINLYELIKANQFAGFSTVLIRRFTTQMLGSLQLMRSHRIVHCDLKPENILLCHPAKSAIKVIDFGSSLYTYIQSRFYRSPEVILGMNYAMAIDMWSLGCILAELFTGVPIFPGENEQEQLACIMEILGVPERYIVEKASRRKLFFDATGAPRPFVSAKGRRRRPGTKNLAAVLKCDDDLFVDFIAKCLTWDPDKRLKPQPAMRHPWILAGRKRYAPTPSREEKRSSDRVPRLLSNPGSSMRASHKNLGGLASPNEKGGDKGKLLISPPAPLMARQPQHLATSSTSRLGQSASSSKLAHQAASRTGSYSNNAASKLSIG
ncbi:hypothetical protein IAT38_006719 [Cryptococcus sp. DSM 104549]